MAVDSLVLAGLFELMGGTVPVQSDIPELVNDKGTGVTFRLLNPAAGGSASSAAMTWNLGMPQPTTDIVQSLLLDGERPFGSRASNRTITLPVLIRAPDNVTLTSAQELLMQVIDQQSWTLAWTPAATGLTLVLDCFRALPSVFSYGFQGSAASPSTPVSVITISFQALPYGRSDPTGLVTVPFSSPIIGQSPPPSAVVLDNFSYVSGTNWTQSSQAADGGTNHSAMYTQPAPLPNMVATYGKSGLSLSIAGLTSLSTWFGQSFDTVHWYPWMPFGSNVTLNWTLTDNGGHFLRFHVTYNKVPWSVNSLIPKWTRITAPIPQGVSAFNYNAVTAYKVVISNDKAQGGGIPSSAFERMQAWLYNVTANPPTISNPASVRGTVYNLMGVPGTARTPFSAQFQLPSAAPVVQTLYGTSPGLWWPPNGVTSVLAECVGAGGAGAARTTSGFGGGGGGGEYAAQVLTVAAGTPVPYQCGTGGLSGPAPQVVTFSQPGTSSWTCPAGVTAAKVECWGGGSTGAAGGGGGGGGEYACEPALALTPGSTYQFTIGRGGTLLPGLGSGGVTTFPGDSVTVTANPGLIEKGGGTLGGAGGTGSSNTTHYNGGTGGASPGSGGGGGGSSGGSASAGNTGTAGYGITGGAGAAAVTGGGAGGTGASSPGWPVTGSSPGGGGGGGCNSIAADSSGNPLPAANNPGANGAPGQVQITYTVNGGSPVNGGSTTFGSATGSSSGGVVVTGHGGTSAALNSATGASGGTGSANTAHNGGGAGFTAVIAGGGGGGSGGSASAGSTGGSATASAAISGFRNGTGTSATFSPSFIAVAAGQASVVVVIVHTASTIGVTDSAGNVYALTASSTAGGECVYVLTCYSAAALTTSATITVTISVSQAYTVASYALSYVSAFDVAASATGTSTAPSVAAGAESQAGDLEFTVIAGNTGNTTSTPSGWTSTSNLGTGPYGNVFWRVASSTAGDTCTSSYASSSTWAAVGIAFKTSVAAAGAAAVKGGGKGGNGAVAANTTGLSGGPPGGGGGGAWSSGTAVAGGQGGQGYITLTHTPPLQPFSTLIAHRPGPNAPASLNPCMPVGNVASLPPEITVPPLPGTAGNAMFAGTYSIVLTAYSWDSPGNSRQVSVTVNQYEYQGKARSAYQATVTRTFTPSADITNGIVLMGEVTLPVNDIDPSNTSGYFTVTITDTDLADTFLDVLFLDTQGQTVIINIPAGGAYTNFYIDEPTPDRDLGRILGSDLDRSQAVSVLSSAIVSGGPFYIDPGGVTPSENAFLVYSTSGAPSLSVSHCPRWYLSRIS